MQPLYSLDFSLFTTCFGLNRPSSGISLRQNCYLHLISVMHSTCNCIVSYLCCGYDQADISQSTIHCDSLFITLDTIYCCTPIVSAGTCLFAMRYLVTAAYTCLLRIYCLAAAVVSRSLPSNGSRCYSICSLENRMS
jgi:hypothetical protein